MRAPWMGSGTPERHNLRHHYEGLLAPVLPPPPQKSWFSPRNLLLPINLDRMHRTKHGSDSEVGGSSQGAAMYRDRV
jgi:hypothetical protein